MPCVRVSSQETLHGHLSVLLLTWRPQVHTVPSLCWKHIYMGGLYLFCVKERPSLVLWVEGSQVPGTA